MLCPNISSPETRVPHSQHLDPPVFCLFHPWSSSSCTLAGICGFVVLSLLLAIFSDFSCPLRRPLRPCQDLDAANSPGLLSSPPPHKMPLAVPTFVSALFPPSTGYSLLLPAGGTHHAPAPVWASQWGLNEAWVRKDLFCLRSQWRFICKLPVFLEPWLLLVHICWLLSQNAKEGGSEGKRAHVSRVGIDKWWFHLLFYLKRNYLHFQVC